jgi:carbon storage regulator
MLVLTRKCGETIRINDDIEIRVVRVIGGRVQIGVTAPRDVKVMRGELIDKGKRDAA